MKIREFFCFNNSKNKYDVVIRLCYIIFFTIGFIVFVSNGLEHMKPEIWLLAFICSAFGAVALGTIAKSIVNIVRATRQEYGKGKVEQILKLITIVVFAIATVSFVSAGIKEGNMTAWAISFIGAYGGATIVTALVRVIFTLSKKEC